MWRRRLKEEAAAAAAAAAAEKRRKQEVAGSSPGEVICFQILTSQMGSPAPVGGAGACLVAPKWFCLRYLVRVFFFPHRYHRCRVLVIPRGCGGKRVGRPNGTQPPGLTLPPGPRKSSCALRKVRHRGLKVHSLFDTSRSQIHHFP